MRTCHASEEIPGILIGAGRGFSWRVETDHLYGYCLHGGRDNGLAAKFITDGSIDCETCGPGRREKPGGELAGEFGLTTKVYLTLVLPTTNARSAVSKQVREKGGIGLYIPLRIATALLSDVPIRSKSGSTYSIELAKAERDSMYSRLLELWWPESGRMNWVGRKRRTRDPEDRKRVPLGTTNARLPKNLDEARIRYLQGEGWVTISSEWHETGLQKALKKSNWKPPRGDAEWEPPDDMLPEESGRLEEIG